MLIGELATQSNVSKDTVRLYTRLGLLPYTRRIAGSREYAEYEASAVALVKDIRLSQAAGFTLAEIKLLADEYFAGIMTPDRQRTILQSKLAEVHQKQKALRALVKYLEAKISNLEN